MNIRSNVPNNHVQSISEIAHSQSQMIQLLTIEINEKDKEIERLTAESTEWESKYYDLQERFDNLMEAHKICDVDNERLNNIINNLEYWLKMEWTYNADVNEQYEEAIENTLDRLKALKEGK